VPNIRLEKKGCNFPGVSLQVENCLYVLFLGEILGRKNRQTDSLVFCIRPVFVVKQLRADGKEYSSSLGLGRGYISLK